MVNVIPQTEDVLAFKRIAKSIIDDTKLTIIDTNDFTKSDETFWTELEQEHLNKQNQKYKNRVM